MQPLTLRQAQVLNLLADGDRSPEIATALRIAPETAKKHIKSLLKQMGAKTSANAVKLGFANGLLEIPGFRETIDRISKGCENNGIEGLGQDLYNRSYTIKFQVPASLMEVLEQRRLNRATPYAEKMMPFLNRLLGNLAQAIAAGTAPDQPTLEQPYGEEQSCIWFRPNNETVQQLLEQTVQRLRGDRPQAILELLARAVQLPSQAAEIQNQQQLYKALLELYGKDGRLMLSDVPPIKVLRETLSGRITKEALKAWLTQIIADKSVAASARKVQISTLRNLLHRKRSYLMIDGFDDGIDFPLQVVFYQRLLGFLVPERLARAIAKRGSKTLEVKIADYKYPTDWNNRLKDLSKQLKERELDVIHFTLRDDKTKVSLVSPIAINFARWDRFDRTRNVS